MAPDRIVDAAQLANAVDALSVGLQTFDNSTKQMETICSSFQERLGQLEAEMRPMKMISQKLSAARRHVSEAVDEMEKVQCTLMRCDACVCSATS
jgi:phage-related tail protein